MKQNLNYEVPALEEVSSKLEVAAFAEDKEDGVGESTGWADNWRSRSK